MYKVFQDLGTQWRYNSMNGSVTGLDYASVPFVLSCHGIESDTQVLRDLKVMEAAAAEKINERES